MSVLIKGMEMPIKCANCWMMDGADMWCVACGGRYLYPEYRFGTKDRPEWCPLRPAPEQKHGIWLASADKKIPARLDKNGDPDISCWCSVCGDWLTASDEYPVRGQYCPNCGAKMDKGEHHGR